jgi:quercetin dioxygenase-like cupin family protein
MKTLLLAGAWGVLVCLGAAVADAKAKSSKSAATTIDAADVKWGDAPPVLPKGAMVGVLHGDPFKKGVYAMRLKMPEGYKIPPHWHTQDEQLTIVSGNLVLTTDEGDHSLTAGSYHFLPGKAHHSAAAKGETVVQINGMGPFDIHYLNAADDPSKQAAAKK